MAYKNNQSGITIGGYVPQRVPVRSNLEALSQALNKIDERSDKAIQQKSAITNAIGQLKLNAAEDNGNTIMLNVLNKRLMMQLNMVIIVEH